MDTTPLTQIIRKSLIENNSKLEDGILKLKEEYQEYLIENFTPADVAKLKSIVQQKKQLIGIGPELKKAGFKSSFSTEPIPVHMIKKGSQKFFIVNKRYASNPDWVVGDIAGGLSESVNELKIIPAKRTHTNVKFRTKGPSTTSVTPKTSGPKKPLGYQIGDKIIKLSADSQLSFFDGDKMIKAVEVNPNSFGPDDLKRLALKIGNKERSKIVAIKESNKSPKIDEFLTSFTGKDRPSKSEMIGHIQKSGNEFFVDSNFINGSQNTIAGSELKHLGFGEFFLQTPKGDVQFARSSHSFNGAVGRSHKISDDANGKIVQDLIKGMLSSKKAVMVKG